MDGSFNENLHEVLEVSLADGYGMNVCKIIWDFKLFVTVLVVIALPKSWQLKNEKKNKQREDR